MDHEGGCICRYLDRSDTEGQVCFAAWLRSAWTSPCEWLWEGPRAAHFVNTLGFWLWIAGANVSLPSSWGGSIGEPRNETVLEPLKWKQGDDMFFDDDMLFGSMSDDDDFGFHHYSYEPLEQDLAGHLRKEAYSLASHRMLRRDVRRKRDLHAEDSDIESCPDVNKSCVPVSKQPQSKHTRSRKAFNKHFDCLQEGC